MKISPYWRTENIWVCPNHIPSLNHHHSIMKCTMSNCSVSRPEKIKEHIISNIIKNTSEKCKYYKCDKKRLEGRKYCSDKCRKDRARELYRIRKKLKKQRELENKLLIDSLKQKIKILESKF